MPLELLHARSSVGLSLMEPCCLRRRFHNPSTRCGTGANDDSSAILARDDSNRIFIALRHSGRMRVCENIRLRGLGRRRRTQR